MAEMKYMATRNPRNGSLDYQMPVFDAPDVAAVAARLRANQPGWSALSCAERLATLEAFAQALSDHREPLLEALSIDTGRWHESVLEVEGSLSTIRRWCADAPALLATPPLRASRTPGIQIEQLMRPYPVVGIISPWNFPLLLSLIDAIPALAAGCAVLIKPSEVTPRFVPAVEAAIAKLPQLHQVLAFVTGAGATGEALVCNVDAVCFTGSVATGKKVGALAAKQFIPSNLELGGKDPAIVCDDADLARAARALAWGSMVNAGQSCMSIERVYVNRSVAAAFTAELVQQVGRLRHCYPDIRVGQIGPVISEAQVGIIQRHLADAISKGARAVTGGRVVNMGGGYWCEPTVLVDATDDMSIVREETFAAVLPVMVVDNDDEAIRRANDSEYGLSACVFSSAPQRARRIATHLDAGAVSVNDASLTAPVHDAAKQSFKFSGLGGSRMGTASLARFYRLQAILLSDGKPSPWWFPAD